MTPKPPTTTLEQWKMWVKNGFDGAHLVPLPAGEKGPKEVGWQNKVWSRGQLKAFAKDGYDLGLRTRCFPTLDIDADDPVVVAAVLDALEKLGLRDGAIMRVREGVARGAVIWAGDPAPKVKRRFLLDGQPFALELLGDGQQVKVAGTHPDDGSVFWAEGVRPRDELTKLAVGREDLLDALEAELRAAFEGSSLERVGSKGGSVRAKGGGASHVEQADEARVREILGKLPNEIGAFGDYDTVISRVLAPVYGASGGADWGLELWREWAQSGDFEAENTDAWVEEKWRSFHGAGSSLGMDALRGTALEFGDTAARNAASQDALSRGAELSDQMASQGYEFDAPDGVRAHQVATAKALKSAGAKQASSAEIEADPVGASRGWLGDLPGLKSVGSLDQAIKLMFWNMADNTVYLRSSGSPLLKNKGLHGAAQVLHVDFGGDPALTKTVPAKGKGGGHTTQKIPLADYLRDSAELIRADGFLYYPGAPEFVRYAGRGSGPHGQLRKNLWRPSARVTEAVRELDRDGSISGMGEYALGRSLFGELTRLLFEQSDEPHWQELWDLFLDWVALVVCAPAIKPSFHWLISSEVQGTGKSLMGQCIADLVGAGNWMTVDHSLLMGNFQDYQSNKLIWVDEVAGVTKDAAGRTNRSAYDRIKSGMASSPAEVWINPKMERPYPVRNTSAWLLLSNHSAETLGLERDDRRLVVLESMVLRGHTEKITAELVRVRREKGAAWARNMARACAARLQAARADAGRWERLVSGVAPDTGSKEEVLDESLSSVASAIKDAREDGLIGPVVRLRDVKTAVSGRKTVASSVVSAIANDAITASAMKELGAVKIKTPKRVKTGDPRQYKVWVLPDEALDPPAREGLTRKEWENEMRVWARKMQSASEAKLKDLYLDEK